MRNGCLDQTETLMIKKQKRLIIIFAIAAVLRHAYLFCDNRRLSQVDAKDKEVPEILPASSRHQQQIIMFEHLKKPQ